MRTRCPKSIVATTHLSLQMVVTSPLCTTTAPSLMLACFVMLCDHGARHQLTCAPSSACMLATVECTQLITADVCQSRRPDRQPQLLMLGPSVLIRQAHEVSTCHVLTTQLNDSLNSKPSRVHLAHCSGLTHTVVALAGSKVHTFILQRRHGTGMSGDGAWMAADFQMSSEPVQAVPIKIDKIMLSVLHVRTAPSITCVRESHVKRRANN